MHQGLHVSLQGWLHLQYESCVQFVSWNVLPQGLLEGSVAEKCPLAPVTEEGVKEREVREGAHVALPAMLPCNVSFTRGQERTVHFAIVGLPEVSNDTFALFHWLQEIISLPRSLSCQT